MALKLLISFGEVDIVYRNSVLSFWVALCALNAPLEAQTETTTVAGERYKNAPGGSWVLGADYRDLWSTPIEVEVLDLSSEAGGLRPVARVGGMQTLGLALKGADGKDYTFRGVDKDPTGLVPEEFRGTPVEMIVQDQIAGNFPGGETLVGPIADAVGVLQPTARLVVMPDDPALGGYRGAFAGQLGIFLEYPQAGFRGASEVINAMDLWPRLQSGEDRVDSGAFLRARLMDLVIGDWDRHRKQWRWARMPGKAGLQPIPEDRDQAFADFEGFALDMGRVSGAQLVKFDEELPPMGRITTNGWDVDRFLLTDIGRSEWEAIAADVQSRITGEVIETAMSRMPPAYYALRGEEMTRIMTKRRDQLSAYATAYYEHLAQRVDVQCTNADDLVEVKWLDGGAVEVRVSLDGAAP